MMPAFALFCSLLFSLFLIVRDCMRRKSVSALIWLPTIFLLILGSRHVSEWAVGGKIYGGGLTSEMGNENAGSPLDIAFYLFVLMGSFVIASLRGFKWHRLFAANTAIMMFYAYFLVSVIWSGDPSGSFKRIVKDFGLFSVIAVIFSEKDPLQSIKAIYFRCAAVLLPLSIVFIKYFPDLGRDYTMEGDVMITGVTRQKNTLGEITLIFTIMLIWDFLEAYPTGSLIKRCRLGWDRVILVMMSPWLLHLSQSKSSLLCTAVGVALVARGRRFNSRFINRLVLASALLLPFLVFYSQKFMSLIAPVVQALGRNMTFTGRTDIWSHITLSTVNPIIGAGFWNFWGGPGGYDIALAMHTGVPNAHCGYVDMYIDGGIIGLVLLFTMLLSCGNRIIRQIARERSRDLFTLVRFAVLIALMISNLAETSFARLGFIWFAGLLMMANIPLKALPKRTQEAMAYVPPERRIQAISPAAVSARGLGPQVLRGAQGGR